MPITSGARISPAAAATKNVEFLSVCLSVRHAFEHQSFCARFRHEGVGVPYRNDSDAVLYCGLNCGKKFVELNLFSHVLQVHLHSSCGLRRSGYSHSF